MQALHATGNKPVLKLENVEDDPLGPRQIRIVVKAAGLKFPDHLMISGKYQVKPSIPFTSGLEAVGEVVELGSEVKSFTYGQRVLALTRQGGCFATRSSRHIAQVG